MHLLDAPTSLHLAKDECRRKEQRGARGSRQELLVGAIDYTARDAIISNDDGIDREMKRLSGGKDVGKRFENRNGQVGLRGILLSRKHSARLCRRRSNSRFLFSRYETVGAPQAIGCSASGPGPGCSVVRHSYQAAATSGRLDVF